MPAQGFETMYRACDSCGNSYVAKTADLRRGWGRCCSKSCSAKLREREKTTKGYQRSTVPRSQHDDVVKQRDDLIEQQRNIIEAVSDYLVARDYVDSLTRPVSSWTDNKKGSPGEIIRAATVMHEARKKVELLIGLRAEDAAKAPE